jgi:tetratricopeptide (TPR) repeat protein
MLGWLARGGLATDAWDQLHAAARRDGCIDAVAAALGSVSMGPRIATVQSQLAAEWFFQAARFCDEVASDDLGAAMHLERCLALSPGHTEAFELMETILAKSQRPDKLSDLYAAAAPHRPRGQQALMLRRAAEWLARAEARAAGTASGADPSIKTRALETWQEIVRLEPGDDEARSRLEALYIEAGRFLDTVRLAEQSLARDPDKDSYSKKLLLERIVSLYADRLEQPERAISAVEQLLALEPSNEAAMRVAERLLSVPGLAVRAASALMAACENDSPKKVEQYIAVQLESTHGSRRAALLARLGKLRQDRIEDLPGAIEAYEEALEIDPSDQEVRLRYVGLAMKLGWYGDVTRVLDRIIPGIRDASAALMANVERGEALVARGDTKRAKTVLADIVTSLSAPGEAVLRAARAMSTVYESTYDWRALCDALDRVAVLETDAEARRDANLRLAAAALKNRDSARAVAAYERLLASTARPEALEALDKLYRGAAQREKYARLLSTEAEETTDAPRARALLMRAAEVRARELNDPPGAIATLKTLIGRFGPEPDAVALLEQVKARHKS